MMTTQRTGLWTPRRIAIYCRISSDEEGRRYGVERQEKDCRALAARLGGIVIQVYVDNDISATTRSKRERPEYNAMLAAVEAGEIDTIIAYTTSRLTRRPREVEDIIELALEHEVQFRYVASIDVDLRTAAGRKQARAAGGNDAGTADDISELVTRQKLEAAAEGIWRGGPRPFGYEARCEAIRPDEAAEVLAASNAILAGASLRSVAEDLNRRGWKTRDGNPWTRVSVKNVLCRALNAGLIERHGEIVGPAVWDPIVPEDVWRAVRLILRDPSRDSNKGRHARRWQGTFLYRCGYHEKPTMICTSQSGVPKYVCGERKHIARLASRVDEWVDDHMIEWLGRPYALEVLHQSRPADTVDLHAQHAALRERLDGLARAFADGAVDLQQLGEGSRVIKAGMADLERTIAEQSQGSLLYGLADAEDPRAAWKMAALDRRRAVIDMLMVVTILPETKGRKPGGGYYDPTKVDVTWRD